MDFFPGKLQMIGSKQSGAKLLTGIEKEGLPDENNRKFYKKITARLLNCMTSWVSYREIIRS